MPEIGGEPRHHLRRQRDLRNEDHHGLPPLQQLLRQTDVHHSLAAAGNAPQQRNARLAGAYLRQKGFAHPALLVVQCQRFRLYSVLLLGDSVLLLLPERHRAAFFQRVDRLARHAGEIQQIMHGGLAVLRQKAHRVLPPLGSPRQRQCLLLGDGQTDEQHHLVLHLPPLLLFAAQQPGLRHAAKLHLHVVAQRLPQLLRGQ